jgi:RNA recognition motif-containing protein
MILELLEWDAPYACRVISNLDYKVSDEDVKELFEAFGPIKRAGVIYDRR